MATGTGDLPRTLPDDRNLTIQLPHHQESISQPSQILNEPNIYPETPPPTYDQALTYKLGVHQTFPPISGMHSVQMSTSNPQIQYTRDMNNFQTPGMNPVLVTSSPRNSRNSRQEIWKYSWIFTIFLIVLLFIVLYTI